MKLRILKSEKSDDWGFMSDLFFIVSFLGLKPPPLGGGLSSRIGLKNNCSFLC
jgi:hypothetical protein